MSLGGPIFDLGKLKWLNGRYLKTNRTARNYPAVDGLESQRKTIFKILDLALPRMETLADFFPLGKHLFEECPEYSVEDLVGNMEASRGIPPVKNC